MNSWPAVEIERIRRAGLLRRLVTTSPPCHGKIRVEGKPLVDFSSNDYMGLSQHPALKDAAAIAAKAYGVGSRASRLMSGNIDLYDRLEKKLACLKGTESSLVFGSGYLCNLAVISSLAGPGDIVLLDRLCHASMVDGALLSGARISRFGHNDVAALEDILVRKRDRYKRVLICIETVYSMDGDIAPVAEFIQAARAHEAMLLADEAHAVGVFGKDGEGVINRLDREKPTVMIGTFGKALGGYGAFCTTTLQFREYLVNKARSLIYSTALPPPVLAANLKAVEILPGMKETRERLLARAARFRELLSRRFCIETRGNSQIIPLILHDIKTVIELERHLQGNGILARAIRPPTVPKDSPRIRFSFSSAIEDRDISKLEAALARFFKGNRPR